MKSLDDIIETIAMFVTDPVNYLIARIRVEEEHANTIPTPAEDELRDN